MHKEPVALYIFRFVLGLGLFAFMLMLYWSSALVEQDLQQIHSEIAQLSRTVQEIHSSMNALRSDAQNRPISPTSSQGVVSQIPTVLKARPHLDKSLPNLLEEDRFYAVTLPKILGEGFVPSGVLRSAIINKPDNLHPFSNWADVGGWNSMCNVSVAQLSFGIYETLSPDMAIKVEEREREDSKGTEYWVHLRDGVYWNPLRADLFPKEIKLSPHFLKKHQVTAADFKFYFDALMNPAVEVAGAISLRNYFGDIEEIKIVDPLTFIVRWNTKDVDVNGEIVPTAKYISKQMTGNLTPLPSFVYQYLPDGTKITNDEDYRSSTVWAQNFNEHWAKNVIVSCGRWFFDGMTEREIRFRRNPDFYFPLNALINEQVFSFKGTPDAIWQDFKVGHVDTYGLQPNKLIELDEFLTSEEHLSQAKAGKGVERLDYLSRSYAYIGWNQATPFFSSKKVRRAMTMAIDRQRIIKQYLNGMGIEITGPFFHHSPSYNDFVTPWPFDIERARRLLAEEGWFDSDGDGIIDKEIDGERVPFRFSLTYYVKNPTTKGICEYIATALKEVGVLCHLHGVDIADISGIFDDKNFDALALGWGLGTPPENPRQLWHSSGAQEKGSSNAVGFSNEEADVIIDRLDYEYDIEKRRELYHRFHAIIHEEAPYTFLYTPKVALLYRAYIQNVFIPVERQDLIPGANIAEPDSRIFWIKQ